jgi:putative transcriptional regulator
VKKALFDQLMQSMNEALEHAQGKRELRTTVLPGAPRPMRAADIRRLRKKVNASQAVFAHFLNVSTQLVQAWEGARRRPEGAALRLLELGTQEPELVFGGRQRFQKSPKRAG